ncbi:glycine C-acetyltransferase [Arcanobacterium haemolyticum]|uniref:2-amino-3-ketobutyrate coenzyme A ligase n=1 Tax=Arcanobacterium haemolyticum (strain ATCC 9345 / DSM 20595 / CCM 5947 / CCUG 17215 / LMG 16163 / NBRC 15585 / NCTC 8452 / 11018) TaxID=644284 RepID=D7BKZ3_ARCHD|nr:glycine C-acetyltransferase [Arcanobacterium haemolyticum]ADH93323.1 2-amino-3-ketobutyrate coenzyme A ligase [Arcanobacterium haemolyticum DSM 20595]QCX47352.1 glycine C-acetyltransferase [Arcanobacterium haemolyticum]SQH27844.1 2-amino-3-ketobutyrate coenzyme A ligase [Arcanobacterium haemolyticum]
MFSIREDLARTLQEIREAGLFKSERAIVSPQSAHIRTADGELLNFCANNYLGLADNPEIIAAAHAGLDEYGYGTASVRFICGTQDIHRDLERKIADYVGMEDAILFPSAFDANGGIFEVLLSKDDAVISDELNHASIIDGVRLSKARRFRYKNSDMGELREQLVAAREGGAGRILIVTDGVFSMDGYYAKLPEICDLAEEFGAMVMVDDSHATGIVGEHGSGTPSKFGVADRVDILSGTLGKALGGASGGYIAGPAELVALLKQRARPYLFSNAVAPSLVAGSLKALDVARAGDDLRERVADNAQLFRTLMAEAGFELLPGSHAIIAVMFPGDDGARLAGQIAAKLGELGVYVTAFSYPVVPLGKARIRVQLSAAHSADDVRAAVAAFVAARDAVM